MRALRMAALGLVAAGAVAFGGARDANAAACVDSYVSVLPASCELNGGATTLSLVAVAGMPAGLVVQFTNSPGSFTLTFINIPPGNIFPANFVSAHNNATVSYQLSGGLISNFINQVRVDSNQITSPTTVTKTISQTPLTISAVSGSPVSGSFGNLNTINVTDTLTISGSGAISSFSNEFFSVPEPASLALLGAGLAALGLARRRRG